ncbi:MAG: hypothetical protein AzoDbin1_04218 [Azoarcus sp.]|nr:hypothetical protein [Azoarcus sp.]
MIGLLTIVGLLRRRHARGLYSLTCDIEASQHYGIAEHEPGMRVWRLRCYASGFLRG